MLIYHIIPYLGISLLLFFFSNKMGSNQFSSSSRNIKWTPEQNKLFENALATYDKDIPDRWQKIAEFVGGTNEQEVKQQYEILLDDIKRIESGKVPLPKYRRYGGSSRMTGISNEEKRLKQLKL